MTIDQSKRDLRRDQKVRRLSRPVSAEDVRRLMQGIFEAVANATDAACIACVWPLPGEPDLRPLLYNLHEAGRRVVLPETTPRGQALAFRRWTPGCPMVPGRFDTAHPDGPIDTPDVVLVPLLAFDRSLNRLGYGGGYYDRTLAVLDCPAIGFAWSWQEVETVPVDAFDMPLSAIVTERETITPPKQKGDL